MITSEDFRKLRMRQRANHKFGAIRCQRGTIKFPSKLERAYYDFLIQQKQEKKISYFLRQVPFTLVAGVKYVCDFMVVYFDSRIEFIDVKGKRTSTYVMKKKMVEELYPVQIIEIKKGGF